MNNFKLPPPGTLQVVNQGSTTFLYLQLNIDHCDTYSLGYSINTPLENGDVLLCVSSVATKPSNIGLSIWSTGFKYIISSSSIGWQCTYSDEDAMSA